MYQLVAAGTKQLPAAKQVQRELNLDGYAVERLRKNFPRRRLELKANAAKRAASGLLTPAEAAQMLENAKTVREAHRFLKQMGIDLRQNAKEVQRALSVLTWVRPKPPEVR